MAVCLNKQSTSVKWALLRNGPRVFALLGKATPSGLTPFTHEDVSTGWALTSEFGCLRLERLSGYEEVTGDRLMLPTPFSYDYGVCGPSESPELTRTVFGLLPSELDELITVLRRGSFPVLGFSPTDVRCSISSCTIPGYWPHVVVSNMALCGNVASLETFLRIVISSLPQNHLGVRVPSLQPVIKKMLRLMVVQRRGIHYCKEALAPAPTGVLGVK